MNNPNLLLGYWAAQPCLKWEDLPLAPEKRAEIEDLATALQTTAPSRLQQTINRATLQYGRAAVGAAGRLAQLQNPSGPLGDLKTWGTAHRGGQGGTGVEDLAAALRGLLPNANHLKFELGPPNGQYYHNGQEGKITLDALGAYALSSDALGFLVRHEIAHGQYPAMSQELTLQAEAEGMPVDKTFHHLRNVAQDIQVNAMARMDLGREARNALYLPYAQLQWQQVNAQPDGPEKEAGFDRVGCLLRGVFIDERPSDLPRLLGTAIADTLQRPFVRQNLGIIRALTDEKTLCVKNGTLQRGHPYKETESKNAVLALVKALRPPKPPQSEEQNGPPEPEQDPDSKPGEDQGEGKGSGNGAEGKPEQAEGDSSSEGESSESANGSEETEQEPETGSSEQTPSDSTQSGTEPAPSEEEPSENAGGSPEAGEETEEKTDEKGQVSSTSAPDNGTPQQEQPGGNAPGTQTTSEAGQGATPEQEDVPAIGGVGSDAILPEDYQQALEQAQGKPQVMPAPPKAGLEQIPRRPLRWDLLGPYRKQAELMGVKLQKLRRDQFKASDQVNDYHRTGKKTDMDRMAHGIATRQWQEPRYHRGEELLENRMTLALVLDLSGSMERDIADYGRLFVALAAGAEQAGINTSASLFGSRASVFYAASDTKSVKMARLDHLLSKSIGNILPYGDHHSYGTAGELGVQAGLQSLRRRDQNPGHHHMILLTDGEWNDPGAALTLAKELPPGLTGTSLGLPGANLEELTKMFPKFTAKEVDANNFMDVLVTDLQRVYQQTGYVQGEATIARNRATQRALQAKGKEFTSAAQFPVR